MTTTLTRRQQRMLDKAAQRGAEPAAEIVQINLFDYDALETEARIVVKQRTGEIKTLVRRAAQDIIEIGQKLIEVKEHLEHGQFGAWLKAEFEWSHMTATRFMQVAEFAKVNTGVNFAGIQAKALYLLAAPSTPDAARDEALTRAVAGEAITHQAAKQIVAQHRPPATAAESTFLTCRTCGAGTHELIGGECAACADRLGAPELLDIPPDVIAALDAAQHAVPGTEARRTALAKAIPGVMRMPNGEARGLAMDRYRQLDAEHYAAVGQQPPTRAPRETDAETLAGAGWAPHATKARTWIKTDPADGMLWEMELADDADLARTAQLIRDRPDLDPDDLMLAADGAPVPSVEEADHVAMLASLDYVIDDLTAAGYTVAGWERNTPQGTVYTLRRGADVVRHTLHGLMLMLEATTPKAPPAAPAREALPKLPLALSDWRWESAPSNPGWCLRAPWTGSIVWTTDFFSDPQAAIAQAMRASQLAGRAMLVGAQITGAAGALDRRLVVRHPGGNGGGVYTLDELDQTIEGWVAAKFSAAEARTVAGAQQQRQANAHNPAWKSEGDRLARDLQEADDRGVVLTIAALFDGDGDGLPLASPGELADLEAHLVRAARAWAAGWLVKVGEGTA